MKRSERLKLASALNLNLNSKGFIPIPKKINHIKFDVGLSFSAPHAISWLKQNDSLFVFGFEPLYENVAILRKTLRQKENLNIKSRFLIVNCALGESSGMKEIFVTKDKGLASILPPKTYSISEKRFVLMETLDNFLNLIDMQKFAKIDYIKTDCQGYDLQVLRGAVNTLKKTVIVSCEAESEDYLYSKNSPKILDAFLNDIGFEYINKVTKKSLWIRKFGSPIFYFLGKRSKKYIKFVLNRQKASAIPETNVVVNDPTFINSRYKEFVNDKRVTAYQFN